MTTAARPRDAARSREAILAAAEVLFAERGFDRTSLQDVGAAAGLSRGAPAYFFGAKEPLYLAVLERAFAARQDATEKAFAPLHAWTRGEDELRAALTHATDGYLEFLLGRPSFVQLMVREELAGGARLHDTPRSSTAMHDAFGALRDAGLDFDPDDAVVLFVSLTFSALALGPTLMRTLGRDLAAPGDRARHSALVVEQLLHLLRAG